MRNIDSLVLECNVWDIFALYLLPWLLIFVLSKFFFNIFQRGDGVREDYSSCQTTLALLVVALILSRARLKAFKFRVVFFYKLHLLQAFATYYIAELEDGL